MSKRRKLAYSLAFLALLTFGGAALVAYAIIEPKSAIGFQLFRLRYTSSSDRAAFLTTFSGELARYEGGAIPAQIDSYLFRRFLTPPSESECIGIVDFFIHQQARGRPGWHLHHMGDAFVERVFSRIPSYDEEHRLAALATIEGYRRGDPISKFYLSSLASAVSDHKLPFDTVLHLYQRWWRSDAPWSQKAATNPIAQLPYDWSGP